MMSSCYCQWCLITIWSKINSSLRDTVRLLFYVKVHMVTHPDKIHFVLLIIYSSIAQTNLFTLKSLDLQTFLSPDYSSS